jgi:hypothetical protein
MPTPARASVLVASGSCGDDVRWVLDDGGTLTVSGMGPMEDYWDWNLTPWFSLRNKIFHVVIADGVTVIGELAFNQCANLVSVDIPDSVTAIHPSAFYLCSSLTDITLPDGLTDIHSGTFYNCSGLTALTIPDSVTYVGRYAFEGCTGLTVIRFPADFAELGADAFSGCSSLTEIYFTGNAPVIGSRAFDNVTTTVYYPMGNPSWTADVMQNYNGNITWLPYCSHNYESVVTPPTCAESGYTTHTCPSCGDSYTDSYTDPTGHLYENGICTGCGLILSGDVTGDNAIDFADAFRIVCYYREALELTDTQLRVADMDGNGIVDLADAYAILLTAN